MKKETIIFRFNKFKQTNIGAIPTLSKALRGMNYGIRTINDAFKKFVPKSEYEQNEHDEILNDLYSKTKENEHAEIPLQNKGQENTR